MDRDLILALMVAVSGSVLAGMYYFSDTSSGEATVGETASGEASAYKPNDIRYPLQQEEQRARAKAKKKKTPPMQDNGSGNDYADDSSGDSDVEQPVAEEPEIQ
ncbi:MAG: hypothetical protein ABL973_10575 [Micropepsaceae bacterium]